MMGKPRFKVGDNVVSEKFGKGVVKQVFGYNPICTYDIVFEDGTAIWLNQKAIGVSILEEPTESETE